MTPRVVILGFDAGSPQLIDRWTTEGVLPNIARLKREGAGGILRSTTHPISPTAWSTAVTGMNPGNHGVFDWHQRDPQRYHSDIVNASSIKAPTLWQRVNQAGLTSGILNVPLTFPPRPLDGWMISGILTPPGARIFTYPAELRQELDKVCGGYRVFFGVTYQEGNEQAYLDALHDAIEHRRKALLYLLQTYPTDLVLAVFMESDHIIHDFWKYMDTTHPSYRPEYRRFENAIRDVYRHLDSVLGDILPLLERDTTLFLVSDHGCGPYYGHVFINKLLMGHDLLVMRRRVVTLIKLWLAQNRVPERIYALMQSLNIDLRPLVPKQWRRMAVKAGLNANDVDWKRTRAYVSGEFGQISVNLAGREGQGIVDPRDQEAIIEQITALLCSLVCEEDNQPLVDQIWRPSALYHGAHLDTAPELLFCMRGYTYLCALGLGLHVPGLVERPRFAGSETSGGHMPYGILCAVGPGIRPGTSVKGMNLVQLAPTAMYALGIPVPYQMDGRVIEDLYDPTYLRAHPIQYIDERTTTGSQQCDETYDAKEAAQVESRLRNLGYLE